MAQLLVGARGDAGTSVSAPGPVRPGETRPIGSWAFADFAVASFGGPLPLAALAAPGLAADAAESAGLAMIAAAGVFALPFARQRERLWPACALSLGAGAFAVYGIWTALQQASS